MEKMSAQRTFLSVSSERSEASRDFGSSLYITEYREPITIKAPCAFAINKNQLQLIGRKICTSADLGCLENNRASFSGHCLSLLRCLLISSLLSFPLTPTLFRRGAYFSLSRIIINRNVCTAEPRRSFLPVPIFFCALSVGTSRPLFFSFHSPREWN